jgi:hypothetical protein
VRHVYVYSAVSTSAPLMNLSKSFITSDNKLLKKPVLGSYTWTYVGFFCSTPGFATTVFAVTSFVTSGFATPVLVDATGCLLVVGEGLLVLAVVVTLPVVGVVCELIGVYLYELLEDPFDVGMVYALCNVVDVVEDTCTISVAGRGVIVVVADNIKGLGVVVVVAVVDTGRKYELLPKETTVGSVASG